MIKLAHTALLPAALALTFTTAHAQTTRPNVLFLTDTGRPGAVDVYVDGTRVEAGVQATDRPSALSLTAGAHTITVKSSLNGQVLATSSLNVLPNSVSAVSLQNNYTKTDGNLSDYVLALASGDTAVKNLVNAD